MGQTMNVCHGARIRMDQVCAPRSGMHISPQGKNYYVMNEFPQGKLLLSYGLKESQEAGRVPYSADQVLILHLGAGYLDGFTLRKFSELYTLMIYLYVSILQG